MKNFEKQDMIAEMSTEKYLCPLTHRANMTASKCIFGSRLLNQQLKTRKVLIEIIQIESRLSNLELY